MLGHTSSIKPDNSLYKISADLCDKYGTIWFVVIL